MSTESASEHDYTHALLRVLSTLGRMGHVVIVGRGAHRVLPPEHGLRVRVIAPLESRVARVMADENLPDSAARAKIDKLDRAREGWLRRAFADRLTTQDDLFDLEVNSASLGITVCADLIVAGVLAKWPDAAL
jgi:cytidylate kinase